MLLGLRNTAQMKDGFRELLFYDIDSNADIDTIGWLNEIDNICSWSKLSYIVYKTKHGYHFVCFTPLIPSRWGMLFEKLTSIFGGYYAGKTIRLSRKKDEVQQLIKINTTYGEVIPNLYNLYARRFNYDKMQWERSMSKYILHFERYRSLNE